MTEFIILTASFTVAILLASVVSLAILIKIMSMPKVMKWYMNWTMKMSNNLVDSMEFSYEDEEQ